MANSERKIVRGVRVGGKTYTPGQEDELDKVIAPEHVSELVEKGYLEGKWSGSVKDEAPSEEAAPAKDEGGSPEEVDLSTLKKDELLAKAEELGVAVDSSLTKAEIIEAIQGHKE